MAKKKNIEVAPTVQQENPVVQTLKQEDLTDKEDVHTHYALGTFRSSKGGWFLAKIPYNPETGTVGKLEKVGEGEERIIVNERFKIAAIENKIVG